MSVDEGHRVPVPKWYAALGVLAVIATIVVVGPRQATLPVVVLAVVMGAGGGLLARRKNK